jgi:parallel beta-helix repeat protein
MPENAPPLKPVEHLVFQGLDFECARQDALRITGAQDCQVVRCRATNVGNIGINLGGVTTSFEEEGNPRATPATGHPGGAGGGGQILLLNDPAVHCRVAGCDVWSSGSEGIMLFGTGNTAENNHVYDIGLYAKDAPCINLLGERNVARRNTLHDSPRCAIFIKGANNVAELNDVHHSVLETSDMGGIRMVQRNAWLKGNIIRWQEGTHYESPFFTWGIYLDDYTCRTTIFGNIVARTGRGGVMLHGGGDNLVENNMVVNAGTYQIEFAPMNPSLGDFQHVYRGNRVERNVLVSTEEGASPYRLVSRTEDLPEIAGNLVWFGKQEPFVMVEGLMAVKGWGAWLQRGIDKGSVLGDPHFENAKADDFRLRPDSPAWKLGFQRIPVEQIGCFKSPERASWPIQPNYDRFREKPVLYQTPGYTPGANSARAIHFIGTARDDFESDPAGARPRLGDVSAPKPSQIVVTDEIAASGKHCLKFVDAPGLPQNWLPRIYYPLSFSGGVVVFSADFRIDGKEPATFYIDPRQYGSGAGKEYISGPMLTIESTGDLRAGNQTVTRVPFDQWFTIRVRMRLGPNAPKQSDLTVTARGGAPRHFKVANVSAQFSRLERVVISSLATERTVFYLDNLSIAPEGQ